MRTVFLLRTAFLFHFIILIFMYVFIFGDVSASRSDLELVPKKPCNIGNLMT